MRKDRVRVFLRWAGGPALFMTLCLSGGGAVEAHKPTVTKFTYLRDIYPIFHDRCGSCHRPGGVAPMSLLSYKEAYPWAASIKNEVLNLQMPPWYAEERYGAFKHSAALTPGELNTIVDWCLGGTPEGEGTEGAVENEATAWRLGEPDLTLSMEAPYQLDAGTSDATRHFVLASGLTSNRSLRALDLRPTSPNILRSATILLDTSGRARELEAADGAPGFTAGAEGELDRTLGIWLPGERGEVFEGDVGIEIPAGADIVLRLHYEKTWLDDGSAVSDQSQLALYFHADPPAESLESLLVTSSHAQELETDLRLVALLPQLGEDDVTHLYAQVLKPDGTSEPLLGLLEPRADWPRRYWLETPLSLPKGSRIELRTLTQSGTPSPTARLLLNVVPE